MAYAVDIKHWLGGFLMLSIPVILGLNLCFFVFYLISGTWKFFLSLLILLVAAPLLQRTFKFNLKESKWPSSGFSMLSYNVMYFGESKFSPLEIENYILEDNADIICLQEVYLNKDDTNNTFLDRLKKSGKTVVHGASPHVIEKGTGAAGLVTASKYPILDFEVLEWKPNKNGILKTDLLIGEDTVRVFNVQLRSMGIRVNKVIEAKENQREKETRNILSQLKHGFEDRVPQVDFLVTKIEESPYPVLIVGDLNELPYGYAYGQLSKKLLNSFETGGKGFGFTYHKVLNFLRIDNQFYSEGISLQKFKTDQSIKHSDHYPIKGWYSLP